MNPLKKLDRFHVVRLNAELFPVSDEEARQYKKYGLKPVEVEANTPCELVPHVADCDAVFAVSVTLPTGVIESLARCRVISRLGTGTDKIDVKTATARGILVTNVPYFCVEEQADHTMAFLLALERKLPQMARDMAAGAWKESRRRSSSNQRLCGRTLGLVGFGNSARAVARRARGFGLRLIATRRDMTASREEADELDVEMVTLDELLTRSDYVSLHLPLSKKTYHLFDAQAIQRMKAGAFLINTSRGALVDETALVGALRSGHLAGAGIDTFEDINLHSEVETPPDHPLLSLDNVVLTPHVAAYSVQAREDVSRGGVQNLAAVLNGHWPRPENIVNPEVTPNRPLKEYMKTLFEEKPL